MSKASGDHYEALACRFLQQQGLVAVQGVQAFEPALQVFKELRAGQLHGAILSPAVFRRRAPKTAGA